MDVSHLSEIEAEAYAIADNRTQERGDNDAEQLAALLVEIAAEDRRLLLATGYDGDDVDALLAEAGNAALGADDPGAQIDRAEELQAKWQVQRGDVWQIGAHRLMCGDSTNAEDVARLMADANCQTLIFDPPWDAGIKTSLFSAASILVFTDGARAFDTVSAFGAPSWVFTWDCISSWYTPNRPLRRAKYCFWYGDIEQYIFDGAHYGDAGDVREVQNTRGSYTFQPDPRGKHLSDIFSLAITAFHSEGMHSHEKPIDWMRLLIGNCGGGDVYDPFTGSGTTLVACEQLGRRGYGMEIEPKYCAVTLERLVGMGLTPELVNGVHTKKDE